MQSRGRQRKMLPPFVIIDPFGPADESFKAPEQYEEYPVVLCGDTVILYDGLLKPFLLQMIV